MAMETVFLIVQWPTLTIMKQPKIDIKPKINKNDEILTSICYERLMLDPTFMFRRSILQS